MDGKRNNPYPLYVSEALILLLLLGVMAVTGVALLGAFPSPEERLMGEETAPSILEEFPVRGEVLMIEGAVQIAGDLPRRIEDVQLNMKHLYVMEYSGGAPVKLLVVTEQTWRDDGLSVGDTVEVWASENGEALFINKMR